MDPYTLNPIEPFQGTLKGTLTKIKVHGAFRDDSTAI